MENDVPAASPTQPPKPPPPLIIKADELDSTGTDVSTPVPDASTPITPALQVPPLNPPRSLSPQPISASTRPAPARPILRREASTPAPPSQPPPQPPQQRQQPSDDDSNATDSLSLQQLRHLVTNLPRLEPQAYAYEHADTRSFAEEVEEWFPYSEEERYMLLRGKEAFETQWERWQGGSASKWTQVEDKDRESFLQNVIKAIGSKDDEVDSVECLAYLAMGCWGETAGVDGEKSEEKGGDDPETAQWGGIEQGQWTKSAAQIKWIRRGCQLLVECGAAQVLFKVLRKACDGEQEAEQASDVAAADEGLGSAILRRFLATNQALTALYLMVEVGRWGPSETKAKVRQAIEVEAGLLQYLTQVIARTRWQDSPRLPFTRILLLYWKIILLMFGGSEELNDSKRILRDDSDSTLDDNDEPIITASPLDYHLFRQEITSKYPAYNPPQPLIPIELENNSILPPLPSHPSRRTSHENLTTASGPNVNGTPGSIFNQPVHIATPAPSPPPSPAASGGKGGKKQNYQTNQNFPFLYPPLDETSNIVGGKGKAELQDKLVRKRWEGSDVPASILEAGQLFASRMRMSRSIRQLWDVRERFIRHERGWDEVAKDDDASSGSSGSIIDEEGESDDVERESHLAHMPDRARSTAYPQLDTSDEDVRRRLDGIEDFYRNALPHLQSVVLVLWKIIFTNVSYMATQANGTNGIGVPNGISFPEDNPDCVPVKRKINVHTGGQDEMLNGHPAEFDEEADPVLEELNSMRLREISSKAISAILLMLLKWFKLSHILKYEYLTQLLLDANYLPLILKYFAHQDVDRAVDQKIDRDDLK
ncbi:MAG: hypothetical protein LQ348_005808 [Seirophora lacunosa]|nr:MAG: hypothetical protein LQ348_005808 [Seirophora lacunosa]